MDPMIPTKYEYVLDMGQGAVIRCNVFIFSNLFNRITMNLYIGIHSSVSSAKPA